MLNTSDSREEVEDIRWFLKRGTETALWNSIENCVEVDCMHKQENRWQNAVILTGNRKRVALMTVCRTVDSQASGLNSSKSQCQRRIGRVASAKTNQNEKFIRNDREH